LTAAAKIAAAAIATPTIARTERRKRRAAIERFIFDNTPDTGFGRPKPFAFPRMSRSSIFIDKRRGQRCPQQYPPSKGGCKPVPARFLHFIHNFIHTIHRSC
jgi:hypothetical protein